MHAGASPSLQIAPKWSSPSRSLKVGHEKHAKKTFRRANRHATQQQGRSTHAKHAHNSQHTSMHPACALKYWYCPAGQKVHELLISKDANCPGPQFEQAPAPSPENLPEDDKQAHNDCTTRSRHLSDSEHRWALHCATASRARNTSVHKTAHVGQGGNVRTAKVYNNGRQKCTLDGLKINVGVPPEGQLVQRRSVVTANLPGPQGTPPGHWLPATHT
jgi:hypothetical protein